MYQVLYIIYMYLYMCVAPLLAVHAEVVWTSAGIIAHPAVLLQTRHSLLLPTTTQ